MNAGLVAGLISAWTLGTLFVASLWVGPRRRSDVVLIVALGTLVGLGVTSGLFFVASLLSRHPLAISTTAEFVVIGALIWRLRSRGTPSATEAPAAPAVNASWLDWALATVLVQLTIIAAVIMWRVYQAEPYGSWDAWAIWNMHARFLLRAGPAWPALMHAPPIGWIHPDYPWLVPASVARLWAWSDAEMPAASALVSVELAVAGGAVLVAGVARLRGLTPALLGGLLLVGTPFFVTFSANEHADLPLASCMLAAVVVALLGQAGLLAGLLAGLAAWTKNEGVLFAFLFAAVMLLARRRAETRASWRPLLLGLAVMLVPLLLFKVVLAPTNDLLASPLVARLAQAFGFERHRLIWAALWRDGRGFGEWTMLPYLAMAAPFLAWRGRRRLAGLERGVPIIAALMLLGYYVVYLLTPQDLSWHLETSLVRLLLQLWPLVLLAWCLTVPVIGNGETRTAPRVWPRMAFLIANAMVGLALVTGFTHQRAANELALRRDFGGTFVAVPGEGWHNIERYGRDTWIWSAGNATLRLYAKPAGGNATLTLRAQLRSLSPRTITVRLGDRELWRGRVEQNFVPIEIAGLALPPGESVLEFSTDAPATPEPHVATPRPLAFALYNLRLQ